MASILPNFEYDIFISYRHNDNRSGWVTEFVKHLNEELAATIKEPISVYFDSNPHDGLLETHNVDKSLEGKLKCLIFVPVLSQTYCDPKSFAWQHEFVAFNKLAKEDQFGRDVKLSNGNVAGRILPIKIHDLDAEDKAVIENEIGGVLRAIEFIYKEPGVNRPLAVDDSQEKNLTKTRYKNQVNKVANAVKEIVVALKNPVSQTYQVENKQTTPIASANNKKYILAGTLLLFLLIVAYFVFIKPSKLTPSSSVILDKSVAVLPFVDMSPGKDQEWFSDGLTEELLNSLSRLPGLNLIARTSSFAFKGKNIPVGKIADSLGVAYILEGSVRKVKDQLRITVQLIQADKGMHIWSNTYDRTLDDVFAIQENIAESIAHTLNIFFDEEMKAHMFSSGTRNVEAYEEYLKGSALFSKAHQSSKIDSFLFLANRHFERAIALDKEYAAPYLKHQDFYGHYFIHHLDIRKYLDQDMSEQKIYQQITLDLDAAIRLEKNPAQRLIYEAEKITLSSDWSQWPAVVEKFKKMDVVHNADFPGGFFHGLMLITNPEITLQLMRERLRNDPFNKVASEFLGFSLIRLNEYDSAEVCLERYHNTDFNWLINLRREKFTSALDLFDKGRLQFSTSYHTLLKLLAGKYNGSRDDIHHYLRTNKPNLEATLLYNALGEYEKADSIAHVLDSKFLGPSSIADFLTINPICFRLSATPNFTARLKELGIDPVQFEKEHYYRFPVVTLK